MYLVNNNNNFFCSSRRRKFSNKQQRIVDNYTAIGIEKLLAEWATFVASAEAIQGAVIE